MLILVFVICLLLAVAAVTDISAGYLRRRALSSLADGAAVSLADEAAKAAIYDGGDDEYVSLSESVAREQLGHYLESVDAARLYNGLTARVEVVGHTLTVELRLPYDVPFPIPGADRSTIITASASAALPIY